MRAETPLKPELRSGVPAIISVVCGALGIVFGIAGLPLIFFLPAIILGIIGVGKHRKKQTLAAIGLVLGIIGLFLLLLI
ncbi:MAG: hypothetical protein V4649_13340 [Bacteroidota bacterium]